MSIFRLISVLPLLAALLNAVGTVAKADNALPDDERKAISSLVEKLVSMGLPDSKGGSYFVGPAVVKHRFNPAVKVAALPMRYCGKQSTVPNSKEMDYEFTIDGPHFRLSDGRWLLGLQYPLKLEKGLEISAAGMESRELKQSREKADALYPYPSDEKLDKWFENVPPERRVAMKLGAKQSVPLWRYFELHPNEPTLGTFFLLRAGVDDADLLTYVIADARCRDYWRMRYWSGTAYPFDPTGEYSGLDQFTENWPPNGQPYPAEAPSVAFRRDLHRYFYHLLRSYHEVYSDEVVAALAYATVDTGDPQQIKKRIDAIVAAKKIAKEPPKDADLATRLMSWGEPDADALSNFQVLNTGNDKNLSITTLFPAPKSVYVPQREDLPKLFDLLGDDRPTRWIDYQGARCVGENALRAIAAIFEENPLKLVSRAELEPWTAERRKAVNEALVKWWAANGREYLTKPRK